MAVRYIDIGDTRLDSRLHQDPVLFIAGGQTARSSQPYPIPNQTIPTLSRSFMTTMAPARPNFITAWNEGKMGDKEFIVACKGRPFSILMAPQFPTPNVTYMDYDLVQSLNIRMSELQCRKLSYCGQKLRILGKISTSVQCIKDGVSCGNLQYKAHVVEDLRKVFDTHSIAGSKLSSKLLGQENYPPTNNSTEPTDEDDTEHSSSEAATTTEPKKKKRNKKKTPSSVEDSFSSSESTSGHESDEYNDVYTNISTIRTNDVVSMQPGRVFPEPASPRSIALLMRQRCYRAGMDDCPPTTID